MIFNLESWTHSLYHVRTWELRLKSQAQYWRRFESRCGKGFVSLSQLPLQTLLRCPYSPRVQSHASTYARMSKIQTLLTNMLIVYQLLERDCLRLHSQHLGSFLKDIASDNRMDCPWTRAATDILVRVFIGEDVAKWWIAAGSNPDSDSHLPPSQSPTGRLGVYS